MSAIPGVWHAQQLARRASAVIRRHSQRGLVLLYHRVAGPRRDPQALDVSPGHFDAQLDAIARTATPLPLDEFEARRRRGTLPPRAVAVTFDDGYADNLHRAAPLLARRGVPATVFVTAGMVGSNREFWWDDAERVAFAGRPLSGPVPGTGIPWSAFDGSPPPDNTAPDRWTVENDVDPTPRHRLYRALCETIRPLPAAGRDQQLAMLREWAGVGAEARDSHRPLTVAELGELANAPGMTIGAHTMSHPVLASLAPGEQDAEIAGGRAQLERMLGRPVRVFAYPYGTRHDVAPSSVRSARRAGFDSALANEPGAAWRWSSRWRVPRAVVRDWDAGTFAGRLDAWFAE